MSYDMTLHKIAQLAVGVEQAGEVYYHRLAQVVKEKKVKEICQFLAEQEAEHRTVFKKIADEAKRDTSEKHFDVDVLSLMQASTESLKHTGFQSGYFPSAHLDIKQCLEIALHVEEETVKLYQDIQGSLEGNYSALLFKIIREESGHAEMIRSVILKLVPHAEDQGTTTPPVASEEMPPVTHRKKEKTVSKHRGVSYDSFRDYMYIILLFFLFLGLILAMVGPRTISAIVRFITRG